MQSSKISREELATALLTAVTKNNIQAVENLLAISAPVDMPDVATGNTALHYAAVEGNARMIDLLLRHKASAAAINKKNETPIQLLLDQKKWDCVEVFAKYKTNKDEGRYGHALLYAVELGDLNMAKKLLEAGASTTWGYYDGK